MLTTVFARTTTRLLPLLLRPVPTSVLTRVDISSPPSQQRPYAMLPVSTSPEPGSPSLVPLPLQSSSPLPPPSPTPPLTLQKPATSSLSSTSTWPHRYIATPSALAGVLEAIRALPEPSPDAVLKRRHIFFDSEGYELGTTVGKLALIQLGLPNPAAERAVDVFLIDVLALSAPDVSPEALRGLWDVLEDNKRVVKIGWDLKQDWAELFRACGRPPFLLLLRAADRTLPWGTAL